MHAHSEHEPRVVRIVGGVDEATDRDEHGDRLLGTFHGMWTGLLPSTALWAFLLLVIGVCAGLHVPLLWVRP